MTQKQTAITVLALTGALNVSAFLGQWVPAILFAIAALVFVIAAILRSRQPQVSARKHVSANGTSVSRGPEDIRRVREYREQHPGVTILEAVQAVEGRR